MTARTLVVGLDLSLTSTGIAWQGRDGMARTGTITSDQRKSGNGIGPRVPFTCPEERLTWISRQVVAHVQPLFLSRLSDPILVLIEDAAYAAHDSSGMLSGLRWMVRASLSELKWPVIMVAPSALKKFATGKGSGKKEAVISAVTHRSGRAFESSDEVDAFVLLAMGLAWLGEAHPLGELPQVNQAALATLRRVGS